ncbi:diaminopimelate decarboxylase [Streptomyces sp. NPDC059506]|uniref:diaminopimelate decarboxylase n=1 Tax=Streptomyces TaxID=1883 RepID=UPI000CBCDEF7|nr:diaminopimelate decarboxylase [Streptomyces sp. SCUT-3]PLW71616.1 diaminopimelate decarboxylase [Streptomyces sp. DJ]QMV23334.1 diaminopimelate decarboxylase [Streptomyces sp. SCUT-3]
MVHDVARRRELALGAAVRSGLVGPDAPVAGLLDVDGVRETVEELHAAFDGPGEVLHTFAAKACGLVPVLRLLADAGMGCEVAGPGETAQALAAGFVPERMVLDSPAKTVAELEFALAAGTAVNIDNFQELERVDAIVARDGAPSAPRVGLRVNPQVGGGSIGATSTATATSKFGVALGDPGAEQRVVDAFVRRPWLRSLHAHVGSQGCPPELMARGVRVLHELAGRIDAEAGEQRVETLDIGGGLPVNFDGDEVRPTYRDYVAALRGAVPGLFDGRYRLVTEFGRSVLARHGTIASVVEYTKSAGGRAIAVTHAGVQVAARTVLDPGTWPLRVLALDRAGRPKEGPPVVQDVAGPCCFAGDLTARGRELPLLEPGDVVALLDTGAYYFSAHYSYNSMPRPAVHGYRVDPAGRVRFAPIRSAQTIAQVVAESGPEHAEALLAL